MKLSDRDLKLLVLLLLVAVIVCPIFFLIRPFNEKIESTNQHISQLKEREAFLAKLDANRAFYNSSIALLDEERTKIISNYANGVRDENTVMFLADTEKKIPIAMTTLAFSQSEPTIITEASVGPDGSIVDGLSAVTSFSTVSYVASYDSLKEFLGFIMGNKNKMVITSLSADQSDENGVITGSFVLNQYAISGEGRELEPAKIPTMDHGVDNMFGVPAALAEELQEAPTGEE